MRNGENTKAIEETMKEENEDEIDFDFDEIYEEFYPDSIDPYSKIRYNKDGTIVVTDDWTNIQHPHVEQKYKPNAVVETIDFNGCVSRTIYGDDGYFKTQIHSGNHGRPKHHTYGKNGEHAHDYIWDAATGKFRRTTRELTYEERIQNADIIGR